MVLGVDVGGTKIATGLVNERAEVSSAHSIPTLANEGFNVSIGQLWRAIEQSLTAKVTAIGICAPGPLNPKTGVILNPPNLPGWCDIPLEKLARERFGLPVRVENDCNAAGRSRRCSIITLPARLASGATIPARTSIGKALKRDSDPATAITR